jgi:hypothetical protein
MPCRFYYDRIAGLPLGSQSLTKTRTQQASRTNDQDYDPHRVVSQKEIICDETCAVEARSKDLGRLLPSDADV